MTTTNIIIDRYFTTTASDELFVEFDCEVSTQAWDFSHAYPNGVPAENTAVKITDVSVNGKSVEGAQRDFFISLIGQDRIESEAIQRT